MPNLTTGTKTERKSMDTQSPSPEYSRAMIRSIFQLEGKVAIPPANSPAEGEVLTVVQGLERQGWVFDRIEEDGRPFIRAVKNRP